MAPVTKEWTQRCRPIMMRTSHPASAMMLAIKKTYSAFMLCSLKGTKCDRCGASQKVDTGADGRGYPNTERKQRDSVRRHDGLAPQRLPRQNKNKADVTCGRSQCEGRRPIVSLAAAPPQHKPPQQWQDL